MARQYSLTRSRGSCENDSPSKTRPHHSHTVPSRTRTRSVVLPLQPLQPLLVISKAVEIFADLGQAGLARHSNAGKPKRIATRQHHAELRRYRTNVARILHLPDLACSKIARHAVGKTEISHASPHAVFNLIPRAAQFFP